MTQLALANVLLRLPFCVFTYVMLSSIFTVAGYVIGGVLKVGLDLQSSNLVSSCKIR